MARPKLEVSVRVYRFTVRLREGRDDDLIKLLDAVPVGKRSNLVASALRGQRTPVKPAPTVKPDVKPDDALAALVNGLFG
jgi:hypothetical protein